MIGSVALGPAGALRPPPGVSQEELAFRNRTVLDGAYPAEIRPGNQVEARRRAAHHRRGRREIPDRRGTIFDLTICNSNFLADAIKNRFPGWQVMSNEDETSLNFRLIFYKYRIKKLTVRPINYIDADLGLRLEMAES